MKTMNEPVEAVADDARRQAAQALLLARVVATAVTAAASLLALIAGGMASRQRDFFADLGIAGDLPMVSRIATTFGGALTLAMVLLAAVSLFFIWSKGRAAAWMAGAGMLLLLFSVATTLVAVILPVVKLFSDLGTP
jgi:hypothetical protein